MNLITALLVDDEINSLEVLKSLLELNCPSVKVVDCAQSVVEAEQKIAQFKPDLVFLDIQMPSQNGFELLKKYGDEIPFKIIFVTSYDHFAINAIKFSALDYLMKPVDIVELKTAVEKAQLMINNEASVSYLFSNLMRNLNDNTQDKSIVVHERDRVNVVRFNEIEYIESDGRYSKLYLNNGKTFVVTRNLKEFEEYMDENSPLLRINKSVIINSNFLQSYSKGEPCFIEMKIGTTFEVSRRRKQEILQKLKR